MGYYVYKYVAKGEIKYIGKTTNLDARIKQHTKDKLRNFHGEIYFFECANQTEMNSWEFMLIQKYHPAYNVVFNDTNKTVECTEPEWSLYQMTDTITKSNIIDMSQLLKQKTYIATTPSIKETTSTTTIISGAREVTFNCQHCGASFRTTNWRRTKGRHYSASCPCCLYSAWAK